MVSELQHQIAEAVLAGVSLDAIEQEIIDPSPLAEEQKSALWLYAEALRERHVEGMFAGDSPR
jgi:hypothetical protein